MLCYILLNKPLCNAKLRYVEYNVFEASVKFGDFLFLNIFRKLVDELLLHRAYKIRV